MKRIEINEKEIFGVSVRTTNANEMNPETAKIGSTWEQFNNTVSVDYQGGESVYGVYYDYASDVNGEFNVLAGTEKHDDALEKVTVLQGSYLVFEGKVSSPDDNARIQTVIDLWGKVWTYFDNKESEYKRAYQTDFEHYKNPTTINLYISIL